jgi:hypothetical protein
MCPSSSPAGGGAARQALFTTAASGGCLLYCVVSVGLLLFSNRKTEKPYIPALRVYISPIGSMKERRVCVILPSKIRPGYTSLQKHAQAATRKLRPVRKSTRGHSTWPKKESSQLSYRLSAVWHELDLEIKTAPYSTKAAAVAKNGCLYGTQKARV